MLLALLFAGCTGAPADDTGTALAPTLTNVQAEIFTPSCAFSTCHGSSGGGASDLDLSDGNAHGELVGVAAVDAVGETLVVAGDAAASYLVKKCTPGATGLTGEPMPDGSEGLDEERLALLTAWIDAGADDD